MCSYYWTIPWDLISAWSAIHLPSHLETLTNIPINWKAGLEVIFWTNQIHGRQHWVIYYDDVLPWDDVRAQVKLPMTHHLTEQKLGQNHLRNEHRSSSAVTKLSLEFEWSNRVWMEQLHVSFPNWKAEKDYIMCMGLFITVYGTINWLDIKKVVSSKQVVHSFTINNLQIIWTCSFTLPINLIGNGRSQHKGHILYNKK